MKFNAVIVDDEKLAREDLKLILENFPEIKLAGEAKDISSAEEIITKTKPDLLFLDIKLKGENGFDLIPKIDPKINVIFVTAYDEYAIKAFEVNALDYLMKPINKERLKTTLDRISGSEARPEPKSEFNYDDTIFILLNQKYQFLKLANIIAICSAGDYSEIVTAPHEKFLSSKPLKEWEAKLPERNFCRIHRSTIINLDYIESVDDWFNQTHAVKLKGIEKAFVMSRSYASKLKKLSG
jgi:two-component system LytT family response regulator